VKCDKNEKIGDQVIPIVFVGYAENRTSPLTATECIMLCPA